jgi:hypothetical protein
MHFMKLKIFLNFLKLKKFNLHNLCKNVSKKNNLNNLYSNGICFEKKLSSDFLKLNKDIVDKKNLETEKLWRTCPSVFSKCTTFLS